MKKCYLPMLLVFAIQLASILIPASARAVILYVSNGGNNTIERFDTTTGADLGIFASTGLNIPEGLAFDGADSTEYGEEQEHACDDALH